MTKVIYNAILSQKQEIAFLQSQYLLTRTLESRLKESLRSSLIKVVTGPRRSGKSILTMHCLGDTHFGYVNFEDNTLPRELDTEEIMGHVQEIYKDPKILFFDEIQVLPRWEQFLNKLHRRGYNLIVSGSNAHLLSGEFASSLTGRHMAFELFPLSFEEFLHTDKVDAQKPEKSYQDIRVAFQKYWERGGFPEVSLEREDPSAYLSLLFHSVVFKDIIQRFRLRNSQAVVAYLYLLIQEFGSRFSASSLHESLPEPRLSITSMLKYLDMAKHAYLFFELEPFFASPRKRMKANRKLYVIDHALASAQNRSISEKLGAILENIVFLELVRRGYTPNENLFYLQTPKGYEVDFLLRDQTGNCRLIQVCYELSSQKTKERELRALGDAAQMTGATDLYIITRSTQEKIDYKGLLIQVLPADLWLLEGDFQYA